MEVDYFLISRVYYPFVSYDIIYILIVLLGGKVEYFKLFQM